jgi:hypothetical protein
MKHAASVAFALAALSGCGGGGSETYSPEAVRAAFDTEELVLKQEGQDLGYVHFVLEPGGVYVDVFPTVKRANEWAGLLYQPVGWGTLLRSRPMDRVANVVVFYAPGPAEGVAVRIRRALRALGKT